LSGYPPFWAEDDAGILELTLKGKYKYFSPEWDSISEEAKDFLNKLIIVNTKERMTVDQAMAHPWIVKECTQKANLAAMVGDNLVKNFNAKRKLKVGMQAVRTAVRMGSFPLKQAGSMSSLSSSGTIDSIVHDSHEVNHVPELEHLQLGKEATPAESSH